MEELKEGGNGKKEEKAKRRKAELVPDGCWSCVSSRSRGKVGRARESLTGNEL
jgi:hypothetical protein